jgi:hypothetical protein
MAVEKQILTMSSHSRHLTLSRHSQNDAMTAALSDLPVELFHIIIDELSTMTPKDEFRRNLQSLRLVCRETQAKTRKAYAVNFHAYIMVDLAMESAKQSDPHLMQDDIFQDSVRELDICMAGDEHPPKDLTTWADEVMAESWKEETGSHLRRMRYLKRLSILTPLLPQDANIELRRKFGIAWQKSLGDLLSIIFTAGQLRLELLQLGWHAPLSPPIPTYLLQGIPMDSPVLSNLTDLRLSRITEESHTEPVEKATRVVVTRTLKDFLSLAPNLTRFEYRGAFESKEDPLLDRYPGLNRLPAGLPIIPTLSHISFTDLIMTQTSLFDFFLASRAILRRLMMWKIKLTSGTWQSALPMLRTEFDLTWLDVKYLLQGDQQLTFYRVLMHRPGVIDAKTPREGKFWEEAIIGAAWWEDHIGHDIEDAECKAKAQEIEDLIADDWLWVCADTYDIHRVVLDGENGGDDVKRWIACMETGNWMGPYCR